MQSFTHGAGLCGECRYGRMVRSGRKTEYLLCEYSAIDPAYEKYPRLPVRNCSAFLSTNNTNEHK